MPNRLIIVESPTKARTLTKFLGSGYTVKASMGHVRDLPKSRLGVDLDGGFTPEYEVTRETQVRELRAAVRRAEGVLLASDPDREGEAIAWHLAEALRLRDPERIVFHEVTRPAVEAALRSPRSIDRDLVAAQEARRVIDRLVGYQLSPLLWRKVRSGLSAGRVQSVAVRLVVDRESEIEAFKPEESWSVDALLRTAAGEELTARLHALRGETADDAEDDEEQGDGRQRSARGRDRGSRLTLGDETAALAVLSSLGADEQGRPRREAVTPFTVATVVARESSRTPPPPYTTSTLQQDASTRLRLAPKRTMSLAQQLYEGVDLGAEGTTGLITYMRTDSTRIAEPARQAAVEHITRSFGKQYVGKGAAARRGGRSAAAVQDAHEAIRPTDPGRTPDSVAAHLDPAQLRLYDLVWRRFVASQMAPARFDTTRVDIEAGDYVFRARGSVLRFDGFTRVLRRDDDRDDRSLPPLAEGDALTLQELRREQHFTQPPPRYTEASLVKELEERGIGRPSTYAAIIEVIQERQYVRQEDRRLQPTELGKTVDAVLRQHFPEIVDVDFTAALEKRLDSIEGGKRGFEPTVRAWYGPFAETLARAQAEMERVRVPAKETGESCPECGVGQLVVREGRFGEFVGCSRYPECSYIKKETPPVAETGESCPECGRPLALRTSRRGPFVGCTGYPECRYIQPRAAGGGPARLDGRAAPQPLERSCPDCGKPLVIRSGRRGPFVGCTGYPGCRHTEGEAPELAALSVAASPPPEADGAVEAASGQPHPRRRPTASATAADTPPPASVELGACPDCGRPLTARRGRYGPFVGCSGYPECRYIKPRATQEQPASPQAV